MDNRQNNLLNLLKINYPDAKIALDYQSPWELLVAVILSAQCTDKMVNQVTRKLFAKYRTIDDYANADIHEFEQDIRSTGFYHHKAANIIATAGIIIKNFNRQVPQSMPEMLSLKGVARKTANVVLGNAYGIVEGIAVDTHVLRISQRLRLVDLTRIGGKNRLQVLIGGSIQTDYLKDADPVKIETELMHNIPRTDWFVITYRIIDHGRSLCKAVNPDCRTCFLKQDCPVARI
jgi:endonuclease-3